MGRRREPRIPMCFPVKILGFDSNGKPFNLSTETTDISCRGACLKALGGLLDTGKKIEIEFEDQKAWFRVQWVGQNGSAKAGRVGVRCLEPGKYIWGIPPKAWEADAYDPSAPPVVVTQSEPMAPAPNVSQWVGTERRQFARHSCRMQGDVCVRGDSVHIPGTVTDISLGGCYIEMLSPLPVGTDVDLTLAPGDATLHVVGKVRSSQTSMGMGLSFTGISSEDFETLRRFAPPTEITANHEKPRPLPPDEVLPGPRYVEERLHEVHEVPAARRPAARAPDLRIGNPTAAEALEAIARVLFRKGIITQAEFAEELDRLRSAKAS